MRPFVIFCWLALAALGEPLASAQVLRLKNGDVIYADRVHENAGSIQYEIGDDSYTIPKSIVQSVEASAKPAATPARQLQVPAFVPDANLGGEAELLEKIIREHVVDRGVLTSIEGQGNARKSAIAYYIAAKCEFATGKFPDARHDFEMALRYDPQNPTILNYYAALLVRTGNPLDAISYAEQATHIAPDSPDAFAVLGYAQFAADRLGDAVQSWKKSLALRPDTSIQHMLERAERESKTESSYSERDTGHFVLHYEGNASSEAFRNQLLATLEEDYRDLSREFGSEPRASIQVVLYTDEAFFDVTRAPSWTAALNDGKLRIPVQGMTSVSGELSRILRHELTHSFVNQITQGRCPTWLNEGIAQVMEGRTLGSEVRPLARLFAAQREIPLNVLEGSFFSLNGMGAALAYYESLAAASYIRDRYGMSDLQLILERIGRGESSEAALRSVLRSDYGHLQDDIGAYLATQAGN